jgi:hypothetical protein
MPDEHTLTLRQADQARTDSAVIGADLEFIAGQLARLPTRAYLCRTLLVATASVWALVGAVVLYVIR